MIGMTWIICTGAKLTPLSPDFYPMNLLNNNFAMVLILIHKSEELLFTGQLLYGFQFCITKFWYDFCCNLNIDLTVSPIKHSQQLQINLARAEWFVRSVETLSYFWFTVNVHESKSIWTSEKSLWQMGSNSKKILRYTQCCSCSQRWDQLQWYWWQNIIKFVTKG